jgi:hypothetical protein
MDNTVLEKFIAFRDSSVQIKNVIVWFWHMSSLLIKTCFCIFFARPKYAFSCVKFISWKRNLLVSISATYWFKTNVLIFLYIPSVIIGPLNYCFWRKMFDDNISAIPRLQLRAKSSALNIHIYSDKKLTCVMLDVTAFGT